MIGKQEESARLIALMTGVDQLKVDFRELSVCVAPQVGVLLEEGERWPPPDERAENQSS